MWPPSVFQNAGLLRDALEHVGGLATEYLGLYWLNQMPTRRHVPSHVLEDFDEFMDHFTTELEGLVDEIIHWIPDQEVAIGIKHDHVLAACQLALRQVNVSTTPYGRFTRQLERFCGAARRGVQNRPQRQSVRLEPGTGGASSHWR